MKNRIACALIGVVFLSIHGMEQDKLFRQNSTVEKKSKKYFALILSNKLSSCISYSPNGSEFAIGTGYEIQSFNATNFQLLKSIPDYIYKTSLAYHPHGTELASANCDTHVQRWNTNDGLEKPALKDHSTFVTCVTYHPNGKEIATSSNYYIYIWDTLSGLLKRKLPPSKHSTGHWGYINSIAYSPDGSELASGGDEGFTLIWNHENESVKRKMVFQHKPQVPVTCVAYHPNGNELASGSRNKTIRLWNPKDGTLEQELQADAGTVTCLAYSPNGKCLGSTYNNGCLIWINFEDSTNQTASTPTIEDCD